jgi:hypothetical protein
MAYDAIHRKKKVREFPVPSRDVTTKLSLGGNNDVIMELFLPRGSLVSDIPAGDGKLVNLFYGAVGLLIHQLASREVILHCLADMVELVHDSNDDLGPDLCSGRRHFSTGQGRIIGRVFVRSALY